MLKRLGILCLFILTFTGLIACSDETTPNTNEENVEIEEVEAETKEDMEEEPKKEAGSKPEEDDEEVDGEELVEPDTKEVQKLVQDTINNIYDVMEDEADKVGRYSWTNEEEYKAMQSEIINNAVKPLGQYITESSIEKYAEVITELITCECDSMLAFNTRDTLAGFTVTDYTEDSMEAESITVNEIGLDEIGWKSDWKFVKEDEQWKLQEHTYTFPNYPGEPVDEDKLLDVTFEDIEESFLIYDSEKQSYTDEFIPIEFVEYIEKEGVRYLVIQMPDKEYPDMGYESRSYIVYNTELGIEDTELTEAYNQQNNCQ